MRQYIYKQQGFTLVELMTGLMLTVLLLAGIFGLLSTSLLSWQFGNSRMEVQHTARYAVDSIVRDLQFAKTITVNSTTKLTLTTEQFGSKTIEYYLDTTSNPYTLRRDQKDGSGGQPVTGGSMINISVTDVQFSTLSTNSAGQPKTIGITLTATDVSQADVSKRQSFTVTTAVTAVNVPN